MLEKAKCLEMDKLMLNFSADGLLILDLTLAIIMFGVALSLKWEDFQRLIQNPRSALIGLSSQWLILPLFTLGLVWIMQPCPSMALGMFLVASCPGGNVSNFISLLAKGNVALSVSLSAVTTLAAILMTPFTFAFWSSLYPPTADLMQAISLDAWDIVQKILTIMGIPLVVGMWTARRFPGFTARITKPIRTLSLFIFGAYIVIALAVNFDFFLRYVHYVILIVFFHNLSALGGGFAWAQLWKMAAKERRTISIETGIQNSGLALVLIFDDSLFHGMGGMAIIAALWGIWHLLSGLSIAAIWSRIQPEE
ncbi:MAG: bile acid:sodium symporter family protein [Bacteroidetes bacterium]|nr:MAG: bile acid:sodium symporter family protein [Bacteroidota bacterium]